MKIIRYIKKLFGLYDVGYEYMVKLDEITISEDFKQHPPRFKKLMDRLDWFDKHKCFYSRIVLGRDFVLRDGYISYLIAKEYGISKVPIIFED